jgi:translocation and assembly module TamB
MAAKRREKKRRPRRDWGRVLAVALSVIFAVIGAVPLGLGLLVRTGPVRAWAARETAALIARELEVSARYQVSVQAWPMLVALEDVVVDASDGGTPFLAVERIAVRPRLFSLLGGHLDAGDVEIVGPRVRAVVEGGALKNLHFKLPEAKDEGGGGDGPPLSSLSVTDARVDATIEGVRVSARELDADVTAEQDRAFEIALRAGETTVTRVHPFVGREATEDAVDDDVICRLEARARVQDKSVLVRRLRLAGAADLDPDPGTRPSCNLKEGDWRNVELRLGAVRVELPTTGEEPGRPPKPARPLKVAGRVHARLPAALAHRFAKVPHASGSLTLDLEGEYDGRSRLPLISGHVHGDRPGVDGKVFGAPVDFDVTTTAESVRVTHLVTMWGDGRLSIPEVTVEPFAPHVPLTAGPITFEGIELGALLRDLGAHPQAHVAWMLEKGRFESFKGHLDPLLLEGPLTVQSRGFEIFDRPAHDPARQHMMGVREGTVRCNFVVSGLEKGPYKLPGVIVSNASIDTPRSHMATTVTLGFASIIDIEVYEGSKVDLAEISPLGADIGIGGMLALRVGGRGAFEHPKLTGELKIEGFTFAGLPVGELESQHVAFEPLVLDLGDAHIRHGKSAIRAPQVKLAFDTGATVVADADVDTTGAPGLRVRDLFEVFHFEKDPRFADVDGVARGKARVRYVLGGREDRCGGGLLKVQTSMDLADVALFGERYDGGSIDADVLWDDQLAGTAGMEIDLHSASLKKAEGSLLVGATVRHGGFIKGNAVASGLPVSKLDVLGAYGKLFEGTASMVAEVGGTLSALEARADVNVSRLRVGPATLGPSHLGVAITVDPPPPAPGGPRGPFKTVCGNPRAGAFDQAAFDRDASDGDFVIDGALFDGQVALQGLRISRQRHKVARGTIAARGLDLGPVAIAALEIIYRRVEERGAAEASVLPGVAFAGASGSLSGTVDIKELPFDALSRADVALTLDAASVAVAGTQVRLVNKTGRIHLAADQLDVPEIKVEGRLPGIALTVAAGGTARHLTTNPDLDIGVRVEPMDLARLGADIPGLERAGGTVAANLTIKGKPSSLDARGRTESMLTALTLLTKGNVTLRKGDFVIKGLGFSDCDLDIEVGGGEARLKQARARFGGGSVEAVGRASLVPIQWPPPFIGNITAKGVKAPLDEGIKATADAELEASYRPARLGERASPIDVKGTATVTQFSSTRTFRLDPIASSLNLKELGKTGRTSVDTYDPANDVVRFNINVTAPRALRFTNDQMEMDVEVLRPGLVLTGTNQRMGARGDLRILPDSKVQWRSNEFLVREGLVHFDDPLKIAPTVDVRAITEYRRYASSSGPDQPAAASGAGDPGAGPIAVGGSTNAAGIWRITLQAHGPTDNLKMTLSSDPPLSQEDLQWLLTLGMTRAELDRAQATALGESVGLEALSTLTGADKAVKKIVPLIDEFRFGTGYSSRTGRTEPTVTVGKRITDNVRANVTTGVSEDREVRSNIEWRLQRHLSVQGSYDNLNDVSSSPLGNIGVDLRWRLEFE